MLRFTWLVCALAAVAWAQRRDKPPSQLLLDTTFAADLTYPQSVERLDAYCREQSGRGVQDTMPEIAPLERFDSRHNLWVLFRPTATGVIVTLRRPTGRVSLRSAKTWMLEIAASLHVERALEFRESPALASVSAELPVARRDLAGGLLNAGSKVRQITPWKQSALFVSADPLTVVELDVSAAKGTSRVTVTTEKPEEARRLLAAISRSGGPRILGIVDELAGVEEDIARAGEQLEKDTLAKTPGRLISVGAGGSRGFVERVRASPEMQKRLAEARHSYVVRYRAEPAWRKAAVRWVRLEQYSRADGKYASESAVGEVVQPGAKKPEGPQSARFRVESLVEGAYHIRLAGETADGRTVPGDEVTYWFDGKHFSELWRAGR